MTATMITWKFTTMEPWRLEKRLAGANTFTNTFPSSSVCVHAMNFEDHKSVTRPHVCVFVSQTNFYMFFHILLISTFCENS